MANSTLCIGCATLPEKERSAAVTSQRCAQCNAETGTTSYGVHFRVQTAKRRQTIPATILTGLIIGVGLFAFVGLLVVMMSLWTTTRSDPTTRRADPAPPDELASIPEVALDSPFPRRVHPGDARRFLQELIKTIRDENSVKQDGFLLARINERKELRGLPFVMGDACRMNAQLSPLFQASVEAVRNGMENDSRLKETPDQHHSMFWNTYLGQTNNEGFNTEHGLAALSQMLAPERMPLRAGLVQRLATTNRPEATKMLAKAAIFDSAGEVRAVAIKALKDRPREESADVLMAGLRYPMVSVASRAAVAMIMLDRKDLLAPIVDFLAEAAPGDPAETTIDGKKVCVVREVVRINHHRNCLLCHAPSTNGNPQEVPGAMPIPGESFAPSPKDAYNSANSNDGPMIRADTTYLRQDFSVMMPVENAAPWPDKQRFDFLVRTRVVQGAELAGLLHKVNARPADYLSANHQAALRVLRELSGQDAAPNRAAWQRVLGLN